MPIVNAPVTTASCEVKQVFLLNEVDIQTFNGSDKTAVIAGCVVNSGTVNREALYRIIRNEQVRLFVPLKTSFADYLQRNKL